LLESLDSIETIIDPRNAADSAGLRYISNAQPGICPEEGGGINLHARRWLQAR